MKKYLKNNYEGDMKKYGGNALYRFRAELRFLSAVFISGDQGTRRFLSEG